MDCREFESWMADYLGEELPSDGFTACEAHLASCPTCRARVSDYHAVITELRRLETVPLASAAEQTASLLVVRRPSAWRRIGRGVLKVSAVLGIGIAIGRYSVGSAVSQVHEPSWGLDPSVLAAASEAGVHPGWIELGRQTGTGGSSFAQHLALLARTVPR